MNVTTKAYYQPHSLDEALGLLAHHGPSLLVIAGGTLAMPLVNEGVSMPEQAMGLRRAGLNTVQRRDGRLIIGATATLTQMSEQRDIPLLAEAAHSIGGWAIRNMGTAGGNLFAPPPAGDFAAALLALDATVTLAGMGGNRTLPLADFYTGFMMNALRPGELVAGFDVPIPAGKTVFLRYGRKQANTPAIVTVAAHCRNPWRHGEGCLHRPECGRAASAARPPGRSGACRQEAGRANHRGRRGGRRGRVRAVHRRDRDRVVPAPDGAGVRPPRAGTIGLACGRLEVAATLAKPTCVG